MKLPRPLFPPITAPIGALLLLLYWISLPSTLAEAKHRQVEVKIAIEIFKQGEWAVLQLPGGETLKVHAEKRLAFVGQAPQR